MGLGTSLKGSAQGRTPGLNPVQGSYWDVRLSLSKGDFSRVPCPTPPAQLAPHVSLTQT